MSGLFYLDVIFMGLIALVLIFTLYRVVGQRIGFQMVHTAPVQIKGKDAVFREVKLVDPDFSEKKFLKGAKKACKVITEAVCTGDMATLGELVTQRVYRAFQSAESPKARPFEILSAEVGESGTEIVDSIAKVSVNFVVEISQVITHQSWVFERSTLSRSPIWLLSGTGAAEKS